MTILTPSKTNATEIQRLFHSFQNQWDSKLIDANWKNPSGGFLKWWYPTTMGFPTKNDHFGVFWGYHHLRKHPSNQNSKSQFSSSFFFRVWREAPTKVDTLQIVIDEVSYSHYKWQCVTGINYIISTGVVYNPGWWFRFNPSEKYAQVKVDHLPQGSGWK